MSLFKLKNGSPRRGQATVEFALAALLFFTVFLAIVEFAHLFYVKLTLQHALREAGRFMVTGRDGGVDSDGNPIPRCNADGTGAVRDKFFDNIKGFGGSSPPTLTITSSSGTPCGQAKETVTLTAQYTNPWFSVLADKFLPGGVPLTVSMTWVNEPFPASGGG